MLWELSYHFHLTLISSLFIFSLFIPSTCLKWYMQKTRKSLDRWFRFWFQLIWGSWPPSWIKCNIRAEYLLANVAKTANPWYFDAERSMHHAQSYLLPSLDWLDMVPWTIRLLGLARTVIFWQWIQDAPNIARRSNRRHSARASSIVPLWYWVRWTLSLSSNI